VPGKQLQGHWQTQARNAPDAPHTCVPGIVSPAQGPPAQAQRPFPIPPDSTEQACVAPAEHTPSLVPGVPALVDVPAPPLAPDVPALPPLALPVDVPVLTAPSHPIATARMKSRKPGAPTCGGRDVFVRCITGSRK
jgi:hypothetical protein